MIGKMKALNQRTKTIVILTLAFIVGIGGIGIWQLNAHQQNQVDAQAIYNQITDAKSNIDITIYNNQEKQTHENHVKAADEAQVKSDVETLKKSHNNIIQLNAQVNVRNVKAYVVELTHKIDEMHTGEANEQEAEAFHNKKTEVLQTLQQLADVQAEQYYEHINFNLFSEKKLKWISR